jgi:hypothetical protein
MTKNEHHDSAYERAVECYVRLAREARALVKSADLLDEDGKAAVSLAALNRLSRELKGEPQPNGGWMGSA